MVSLQGQVRITNINGRSLGRSFGKPCPRVPFQARISNDFPGCRVPDRLKRRDQENQGDHVLKVGSQAARQEGNDAKTQMSVKRPKQTRRCPCAKVCLGSLADFAALLSPTSLIEES